MESPLQEWRKSKGLTQKQLANLAGVSNGHLSEIENGIAAMCDKLKKLLKATGAVDIILEQEKFMEEQKAELFKEVMAES